MSELTFTCSRCNTEAHESSPHSKDLCIKRLQSQLATNLEGEEAQATKDLKAVRRRLRAWREAAFTWKLYAESNGGSNVSLGNLHRRATEAFDKALTATKKTD